MYEYTIQSIDKIVDGDTIDIVIDLGFSIFSRQRLRLKGIDAPETLTKNEIEKQLGNEAKEFVAVWMINQKNLRIQTFKDDKYGRMLVEVFGDNDVCLNKLMIEEGYAWSYDGVGERVKDYNLLLEKRK